MTSERKDSNGMDVPEYWIVHMPGGPRVFHNAERADFWRDIGAKVEGPYEAEPTPQGGAVVTEEDLRWAAREIDRLRPMTSDQ